MIQMNIHGRLGNQMFQYAFARSIMEEFNYHQLSFNFSSGVYNRGFANDLKHFNTISYNEVEKIQLNGFQKVLLKFMHGSERILRKFYSKRKFLEIQHKFQIHLSKILSKYGIYYLQQGYTQFNKSHFLNQYCEGCFESAKYFDNIRDKILKEFTPIYPKLKANLKLYGKIENTNSVCISIRRGDFLDSENINTHYVCTPYYFEKAIEVMEKELENPTFFIFSDDIKWVKKNMKFPKNTFYETGNDPVWEKLRLMYSCKHFIISNSTFSWWAQYLSRNENKMVIAPSRWKNTHQNNDIYSKSWILVDPKGEKNNRK